MREVSLVALFIAFFSGLFVYSGLAVRVGGSVNRMNDTGMELLSCRYLWGFRTTKIEFPYDLRGQNGRSECPFLFRELARN